MYNPLTRDFARKLVRLERFAELVEKTFVAHAEALDTELTSRSENFPEEERQELFEHYAEDYVELSDELPTLLRYSVLTAADSALEVYMDGTCEVYRELHKIRLGVNDLRGTGVKRAREFLTKMAGVEFPNPCPAWTAVLRLHDLRNCIVHADGYVDISREHLIGLSKSTLGLRITASRTITLDQQFSSGALQAYEDFGREFDLVCKPLDLWESVFPTEEPNE